MSRGNPAAGRFPSKVDSLKIRKYIPALVDIGEDQPLPILVKKLNWDQAIKFREAYDKASNAEEDEAAELWGELYRTAFRDYLKIDPKRAKDGEILVEGDDGESIRSEPARISSRISASSSRS